MTIITLPARHRAPQGTSRSAMADERLFMLASAGRRLLSAIEAAAMDGAAGCEQAVARVLADGLAVPNLLAGLSWREWDEGRPARLDLAQTPTFRVFARRWRPGQLGLLRRFMEWYAHGVAEGCLAELNYAEGQVLEPLAGAGTAGPDICRHRLSRGEVRHGPGDGRQLRRLGNLSATVAYSLHVEGLPQSAAAAVPAVMPVFSNRTSAIRPRPSLTVIAGGRRS